MLVATPGRLEDLLNDGAARLHQASCALAEDDSADNGGTHLCCSALKTLHMHVRHGTAARHVHLLRDSQIPNPQVCTRSGITHHILHTCHMPATCDVNGPGLTTALSADSWCWTRRIACWTWALSRTSAPLLARRAPTARPSCSLPPGARSLCGVPQLFFENPSTCIAAPVLGHLSAACWWRKGSARRRILLDGGRGGG